MINQPLNHRIRLVYVKKDGKIVPSKPDVSPDVAVVLCGIFPSFNPASTDPIQEQVNGILQALDAAGMEVGRHEIELGEDRHEVYLLGIRHHRQGSKGAQATSFNGDAEDRLAHGKLLEEGRQRLSTDEGRRDWFSVVQERLNSPDRLTSKREPR